MKEVYLYTRIEKNTIKCQNCAHYCVILPGKRGICGVRENISGKLYALNYGKAVSINTDPVEKKPLFHFLPGTLTLSLATVGCNFSCLNCQNWDISQYPKTNIDIPGQAISPMQIVDLALKEKTPSISYTYVEPTIFSEYALDTMKLAKKSDIKNIWVSNGFMSKESRKMIIPYLDANNIDIKGFSDDFYKKNCGGILKPVLETAKRMKDAGVWIEITTLVIPTLNDDEETLTKIAEFIAHDLGKNTPWHVTSFSGSISWKLKHISDTSADALKKAYLIGKKAGLYFVYSGNIPGLETENTFCHSCSSLCIQRSNYSINRLDTNGACAKCGRDLNIVVK